MASLFSSFPRARKTALLLLMALLATPFLAMEKKPYITVRFFTEASAQDTERFAKPVTLQHPPREAFIESTPWIHEKQIKAIYPFQAQDGTWGCAFRLDNNGRINLEVVSTEKRGTTLVGFISTKTGTHIAAELLIDKPIRDGIITIPNGMTEMEIGALTKAYPVLGQPKKK